MSPAKKLLALLLVFTLGSLFLFFNTPRTFSDELDDITKQLQELNDSLNKSISATKPLESQVKAMQDQVAGVKQHVISIENDLVVKKREIDNGYKNLTQKQIMLNQALRNYYIHSYYDTPLLTFLSSTAAANVNDMLAYQKIKTNQDKAVITNIALSITDLEGKSERLKSEQIRLLAIKNSLDEQSQKLNDIIEGAKKYQQQLSTQIASLTAKQQEIVNARSGSFTASVGDSDLADDYNASIKGFRESAPSGSFAVFSFGAHTHRKGMSQYGAFGRANSGQDFKTILHAYYGKDVSNVDSGGTIQVTGHGAIDFESNYLYGIAEMPSSFPTEALKAQAVAARSYAWRYKKDNKEICTDEGCQVYNAGKAANPPDAWKQAVDSTKGQIIDGVTTYFSSTAGGYLDTMGWDTTDGQGGGNFADRAFEKLAGSPWFYKAWYTKGYSTSSDKCGRSSPWLNGSEMADFVNAALVLYNGGTGDETSRITPITTSCWGGNPYSQDELRSVAAKYGGGVNSVSSVSVLQGNGQTNQVVFQTDKGQKSFNGKDFKTAFNLRAPGYLAIPQNGFAFYNIEQK
jgi:peptidoglycan hydrolase-like amidase